MTGVDKDLATLRRWAKGQTVTTPASEALARVEAELSRLREQRDAAIHQRGVGTEWAAELAGKLHAARDERDEWEAKALDRLRRAEAAEARCARLQQALEWYADENNWTQLASWGGRLYDDEAPGPRDCGKIAREALAGPDTPADSQEDKT